MKNKKKYIYVQPLAAFGDDIIVAVNITFEEIMAYMKKIKAKKEVIADLLKHEDDLRKTIDDCDGGFYHMDKYNILWLSNFTDSWESYETLIHELNHAIFYMLVRGRGMGQETEAQAYSQEYLFRQIRRKLVFKYLKRKPC